MLTETVTGEPLGTTEAGEIVHVAKLGKPVHDRFTLFVKELPADVIFNV